MRQIVTGSGFENAGGTPIPISKASKHPPPPLREGAAIIKKFHDTGKNSVPTDIQIDEHPNT